MLFVCCSGSGENVQLAIPGVHRQPCRYECNNNVIFVGLFSFSNFTIEKGISICLIHKWRPKYLKNST